MGAEQSTPAAPPAASPTAAQEDGGAAKGASSPPSALVVCGPSGVGKGTLIKRLLDSPQSRFAFCVSHTTRRPRPGEVEGTHYHFTTRAAMEADMAAGKFIETAEVHGNLYGTSAAAVADVVAAGKVPVLDVDVQGARQIRAAGTPALFVFIAPPSLEELERRLSHRNTETPSSMARRLSAARVEITSLNERGLFDYLLLNDSLDATAAEMARIAQRALAGLPAEPGQVPDEVRFEEDDDDEDAAAGGGSGGGGGTAATAAAERAGSGTQASSSSNAAAAAAAGVAAASALGSVGSGFISSTPKASSGDGGALATGAGGGGPEQQQQQQPARDVLGRLSTSGSSQPGGGQPAASGAAAGLTAQQQQQHPSSGRVSEGLAVWQGKVAVVTGASSGIGWAVCEALGRAGLRVVAVARRSERLQELRAAMAGPAVGAAPQAFLPVVCDVTKEAEVQQLPRIIGQHWPGAGIDVLVNNAGLSRNGSSLFDGATQNWLEMVSTNILGTAMTTRTALQDMQRRGSWGHIINMVGLSGHRIPDAGAGGTFFAATKHAVKTLTEGLRQEVRAKQLPLRVTGISPGLVETEFFTVRAFGDTAAAKAVTSSMACLQPADVADAVLWALAAPLHMEVNDVVIRPTQQAI